MRFAALLLCALAMTACAARPARETATEHRMLAAFTEMMSRVNAGDAKGYASLYAPDARITIFGSGVLEGRDAIERHEVELLRQFPGARFAIGDVWQKGDVAVAHYAVNCPTPGGVHVGHEGLLFYRFHPSGLIAEERRYLDSLTPMAQLGMLEGPARPIPALASAIVPHVAGDSSDESSNVAIVKASLAKADTMVSRLADDVVLDEMFLPRPFVGRDAVKGFIETWTRAVPDARTEITSVLAAGDHVLVETIVRGTLRGALGRFSADGASFTLHRALIAQLENGRLTRLTSFANGKELAEAIGQWPPRAAK